MTATGDTRVALVTGGAARIGAAIVRRLHERGFNVVLHYRSSGEAASALAAELNRAREASVRCVQADLLDHVRVAELAKTALNCWGRLDVLVNNASTFYPTPAGSASQRDWERLAGSNAWGPYLLIQALAPALATSRGCIINITDIHGTKGRAHYTLYCMAKAALSSLTRSMARELAPAVRVNAIAPGIILPPNVAAAAPAEKPDQRQRRMVEHTCLQRSGSPGDIAHAVWFLVAGADYVTGQEIAVDGGAHLYL